MKARVKAGTYHPLPHPHAGPQRRTLGGDGTHLDRAAVMAAPREMGPGLAFLDAAARRSFRSLLNVVLVSYFLGVLAAPACA